ncbi:MULTISPECIES: SpoIID/LytB domain-containing protein [Pelosinus]|uniref:SpoIID/LytB domain protein n=1 Tax=Pelosinus fermentans B4 TaxID=1149862 RepID=I9LG68_9FIRM|nr:MULTISPECIES: SpoIID/LytB domain-containing protein [Pelosinus]EIW19489.1 SpoIID/LytB domain protein [Pelosinus fermentans B4]EIW24778.1 SpoIID/LytB domain protein [Pelosinus fermentans A11]OAM95941.1 SpoIID/LytB domain protein [Pelosinus fermentans DSM 17108]SDR34563.1 stage II sporulation protein D [Pelosinus fermentans]
MHNKRRYVVIALVVIIVFAASGCSMMNPQSKPEQTPAVPQKQAVEGNEPEILVFMHETGEKKKMKMEEYVAGVVAGEMKNDWPVEALAVQAILARTFTLQAMDEKGGVPARGTQASTDIKEFQAYNAKAVNDSVKKAVEMTRGMVITYQGKPIQAWFHASAGGITATAKEGLNYKEDEPPYIQSVKSPDDLAPADVQNWTASFTKKELIDALTKMRKNVTSLDSIEIGKKGPSGRSITLLVNKNIEVSGPELRVGLDSVKLKSMLLDKVEISGDNVMFTGKGYGHGVGISQWGVNKLTTMGKKPEEIIGQYFKDVTIENRWN